MRELIGAALLMLLAACNMATGDQGNTDGKCYPPDVVGDYRCKANTVQVCTEPTHPGNDLPDWFVVQDCSIPTAVGVYGACVKGTDGKALCATTPR